MNRQNIQEYRFARVPLDIVSSPVRLGATIEAQMDSYKTDLTEKLKDGIYATTLLPEQIVIKKL